MKHPRYGHACDMIEIENTFIVMAVGGTNPYEKPQDELGVHRELIVQNSVELFDIENGFRWLSGNY